MVYKEKAQYCPGEVCEVTTKHEIQKTSMLQLLIVCGFIGYIFLAGFFYNETLRVKPHDLFGGVSSVQIKQ